MRRARTGRAGWAAAVAGVLVLTASCTGGSSNGARGGGSDASRSTSTTEPRPAAGTRLDASGLPAPVSNLAELDGFVTYLTPAKEGDLELVAVDPTSGKVAWRHDAALVFANGSVSLDVTAVDGIVPIARRTSDDPGYSLDGAEADGSIRWSVPIGRPLGFARRCDERLCIETVDGPVRVDPKTGKHETGQDVDESVGLLLSRGTDPGLLRTGHPAEAGGEEVASVPQFGDGPDWSVRLLTVLGTGGGPWQASGPAYRHGDQWVVGVYRDFDSRVGTYGRPWPDDLVALSADDGALRWHRPGFDACSLPGAEGQIIGCVRAKIASTATDEGGYRVAEVAALDPKTGADRIRIPLVPYDPQVGGAYAVIGQDRMLMLTPTGVQDVDLAAAVAQPAAKGQVGWCRKQGDLPEVRLPEGTSYEVYSGAFGRPCALDGTTVDEEALVAPIVAGDLPPLPGVSSIAVGPWVLWNDEGTLAGVVTER
ncbi:MAG: hypothetical protein ACTHN0_08155 [Aquihabitans sp.]